MCDWHVYLSSLQLDICTSKEHDASPLQAFKPVDVANSLAGGIVAATTASTLALRLTTACMRKAPGKLKARAL
jgi:hypothetical protein